MVAASEKGRVHTRKRRRQQHGGADATTAPAGLVPIKLTTLLKVFTGKDTVNYDPAKGTLAEVVNPASKFYDYEAFLTRCAYFARLAYSPSDAFARALGGNFFKHAPADMNDIITVLETQLRRHRSFRDQFISTGAPARGENTTDVGAFFPKSGCSVIKYAAPKSDALAGNILYVCFKGSSSLKDFRRDLNISKIDLAKVIPGAPGTVHQGFYNHMKDEADAIINLIGAHAAVADVERVVVLGHSLGGAMASLLSLMLVHKKTTTKPVHCVTFGAPMLFSDDARNYFNTFLKSGALTLDRVTANLDPITSVPKPFFNHPGYTLLKTELYPTKRTGRAVKIQDIRAVFLGAGAASPLASVPTDNQTYMGFFEPLPFTRAGKPNLDQNLLNYVLPDLHLRPDPELDAETEKAEGAGDKELAAEGAEVAASAEEEVPAEVPAEVTAPPATAVQAGGFAFTRGAKIYDADTILYQPNRILYAAKGFAHGNYMNVGFMACLRTPSMFFRDANGKIAFYQAKKEPTDRTIFMKGPDNKYYATLCAKSGETPATATTNMVPVAASPAPTSGGRRRSHKRRRRITRRR